MYTNYSAQGQKPKNYQKLLVISKGKERIAYYIDGDFRTSRRFFAKTLTNVTHWMEMPVNPIQYSLDKA